MVIAIGIYGKGSLCAGCVKVLLCILPCERSLDFSWWVGWGRGRHSWMRKDFQAGSRKGDRLKLRKGDV